MEEQTPTRNKWHLILGILFLVYGAFRLYQRTQGSETDSIGLILAILFIGYGIFDLYRYFSAKP